MSRVYDSWERLVGAVFNREKLRQLARCESFDSSISAGFSSRLSLASSSHEHVFATRASSEVISREDLSIPSILHDVRPIEFEELKKATQSFGGLIWSGGDFTACRVYKGWIDEQTLIASKPGFGMCVSVKMWVNRKWREDWLREIHCLSQLHHPNLIKLVGHCSEGDNICILVHEFMPKGSLENHLFQRRGHQTLPWATRIKVATDAARALSFLHDKDIPVIHRDFRTATILIDEEYNAKLSCFNLATEGEMTRVGARVSVGKHGYAAPEYMATGHLTDKCVVYSFGVFLLELLSERRIIDKNRIREEKNLAYWAETYLRDRKKIYQIMDSILESHYTHSKEYTFGTIALRCLSAEPEQRPRMAKVLVALEQLQKTI